MGMFFNYGKPGPGVEKDEIRRKGVGLYFELLWRSFGKLALANILYFATSLPILAIYFVFALYFLSIAIPGVLSSISTLQLSFITTLLIAILWGTGPASAGLTYILRNTAREEHFFTCSDFFEKSKESFKRGMAFLAIDIVVLLSSSLSMFMYYNMAKNSGGVYIFLFGIDAMVIFIYTIMHFYMYEFEVTFKNRFLEIYKNSLFMAIATLPMCVVLTVVIYFSTTLLLGFLNPIIVLFISVLIWISVMRFIVDFYVARTIKKKILPRYEDGEE